jgi:phosphatidylglycerol---prolipoprotein diacylglyceryl transferase
MTIFSYLFWNASPEIFTIPIPFFDTQLTLRWYGLLFALGFLISQQILYYIFKKENKPESDVDTLTIYMVVATIIGARLGHVLFYEPERYFSNPLDIIKIWEGGLASHGAAIGILFALWLYSRKNKPGQNYLQILDRIVILVAITGALIRMGNFFNSEIIGKPSESNYGVVFTRHVSEMLLRDGTVNNVSYVQDDDHAHHTAGGTPIKILLEFNTDTKNDYNEYDRYMADRVSSLFQYNPYLQEHISQQGPIDYHISQDEIGRYYAIIHTQAIPRHPAQLYESISCALLFLLLLWIWYRHKENLPAGRIFGIFMIVLWSLRFAYEFLKENQVEFENNLPLNMGQWLSIPLVLVGIYVLIQSYRTKQVQQK